MCLCVCDDFNVHDIVCSYHIGWQTLYLVFIVSGKIGLFSKKMRVTKKTLTPSDFHSANQRSAVFLLLVIGSRIKNGVQRTWDAPTIRQLIDLIICAMYFFPHKKSLKICRNKLARVSFETIFLSSFGGVGVAMVVCLEGFPSSLVIFVIITSQFTKHVLCIDQNKKFSDKEKNRIQTFQRTADTCSCCCCCCSIR